MNEEVNVELEKHIMTDSLNLLKAAYKMQDIEQNWNYLMSQAEALASRYAGTSLYKFAFSQAYSVCERMEDMVMEKRGVMACKQAQQ